MVVQWMSQPTQCALRNSNYLITSAETGANCHGMKISGPTNTEVDRNTHLAIGKSHPDFE